MSQTQAGYSPAECSGNGCLKKEDVEVYFLSLRKSAAAPRPSTRPTNGAGDFWVGCVVGTFVTL